MDCGYIAFSCRDVYPNFSLFYSAQSVVVVHPEEHPVTKERKKNSVLLPEVPKAKSGSWLLLPGSSAVTWYQH